MSQRVIGTSVLIASILCAWPTSANAQTAAASPVALEAAIRDSVVTHDAQKTAVVERAAQLINNIRNNLDACGNNGMLATAAGGEAIGPTDIPRRPAVRWNRQLDQAATGHAIAMVNQQFFDHTDPAGRTVGQRVQQTGYRWQVVGENLAAGQRSIDEAVSGWLFSTGHCEVLTDARFTEFGLARVNAGSLDPFGSYWALVMARPR